LVDTHSIIFGYFIIKSNVWVGASVLIHLPCLGSLIMLTSDLWIKESTYTYILLQVNPKAAESLANPEEYPNLFEDWQVALAVESKAVETRSVQRMQILLHVS